VGRKLILDTAVLVALERGGGPLWLPEDDLALAAISAAEFLTGVERARTPEQAQRRRLVWDTVVRHTQVLNYTLETAAHHARLLALTGAAGLPRGSHDLIIAAHAAETGRLILTTDAAARFADLPQVEVA
jgi:tRNA(fMet)-specific endonuclease VapC